MHTENRAEMTADTFAPFHAPASEPSEVNFEVDFAVDFTVGDYGSSDFDECIDAVGTTYRLHGSFF
jgi:hypothetical protein